jgi:ribosomal protein S21
MLIINVTENESIDRALKKYKRKVDRAGVIKELRNRKHFVKPSVKRRAEVLKAIYKQKTFGEG